MQLSRLLSWQFLPIVFRASQWYGSEILLTIINPDASLSRRSLWVRFALKTNRLSGNVHSEIQPVPRVDVDTFRLTILSKTVRPCLNILKDKRTALQAPGTGLTSAKGGDQKGIVIPAGLVRLPMDRGDG